VSTLPHSSSQEALLAQQAFLRRLARSLVADEQRAEDLAQEAALAALRAGPERLGAMRAWLRRVVRNLATDADRRERLRAREGEATPPAAPLAPDEVAQRLAAQREVLAALERLEEPYQSTLFLRFWDDLAPSAIARRTGVPVATVKTRLARGLARLRAELDDRHGGERKAWAVALVGGLRGAKGAGLAKTAAAVGGAAMGLKLALASAVIGGAAIGAWWWATGDGVEPLRTQVARVEPAAIEAPREQEPMLPARVAGARTAVPVSSSPVMQGTGPSTTRPSIAKPRASATSPRSTTCPRSNASQRAVRGTRPSARRSRNQNGVMKAT
jgi:RNA polymerase sigma-70 factor (ECF subfamily)